ncbi:hypothetical protein ACFL5W_01810 [Thermodesulfobacteriota bacterium]
MKEMDLDDIFTSRLQLLIIMAKAYLKGYPLGKYRAKAIIANAEHVELEAEELGRELRRMQDGAETAVEHYADHAFYQRIQLLARMAKAFARGNPGEPYRKEALKRNLDHICDQIAFYRQIGEIEFLKVA